MRSSSQTNPHPGLQSDCLAQFDAAWSVHIQQTNSRPPLLRQPENMPVPQQEVLTPSVFARMKQRNQRSGIRIEARKVGSLVRVAPVASERKTSGIIGTAMLPRHDVLHVEWNQRRRQLWKAAILAGISGSGADQIPGVPIQLRQPAATGSGELLPELWKRPRSPRQSPCTRPPRQR